MAEILISWELGDGLGHLNRLAPLAALLRQRGHRVSVALCQLSQAGIYFPGCRCLQAPLGGPIAEPIREPANLAEVLYNLGAADPAVLGAVAGAWRHLLELLQPDLLVLDHSPTALLASQGLGLRRVTLGTGFASPPLVQPLPEMRPWGGYPERLAHNEEQVRIAMNDYLSSLGESPLDSLAGLYQRVDAALLTSYAELDHFPQRRDGDYVGIWEPLGGETPRWPAGDGPRIFAYLKPFQGLTVLLRGLAMRGLPSVVYCPHPRAVEHSNGTLRVINQPQHLARVVETCQMALVHAGHGVTARLLLAGIPLVMAPLQSEQYQLAGRVESLGAGLRADVSHPEQILAALDRLLAEPGFAVAARGFADRYGGEDDGIRLARVADRLEALLA